MDRPWTESTDSHLTKQNSRTILNVRRLRRNHNPRRFQVPFVLSARRQRCGNFNRYAQIPYGLGQFMPINQTEPDSPMRETYQLPTTSPAGPPHDHTHPRHSRTHPRHSREGGNPPPCVQTPEETAPLPQSTKIDRIRQNPTKTRVCAHEETEHRFLSLGTDWI